MTEFQKRLPDFEVFDKITMEVIPRYKQSGLSGDEWRQHVEVTLYFKGKEIKRFGARTMHIASMMLGHELIFITEDESIPDKVRELEKVKCFQSSCDQDATTKNYLKNLFSSSGMKLDASEIHFPYYRKFCDKHSTRGDCSREDCDKNYSKVMSLHD